MARRDSHLLAEVERDVLDESRPVATALRKCLALGGQAKSAELREWASRELHGYPDEAPLPEYRKIRTRCSWTRWRRAGSSAASESASSTFRRKPATSWGMNCRSRSAPGRS